MSDLPLGLRQNNPGNIRFNTTFTWNGQEPEPGERGFCAFRPHPVIGRYGWGLRAMAKLLLNYQRKHRLRTIRELIGRWAPENENDTAGYARFVAERVNVDPDDLYLLEDAVALSELMAAMILMENGRHAEVGVAADQIPGAVALAMGEEIPVPRKSLEFDPDRLRLAYERSWARNKANPNRERPRHTVARYLRQPTTQAGIVGLLSLIPVVGPALAGLPDALATILDGGAVTVTGEDLIAPVLVGVVGYLLGTDEDRAAIKRQVLDPDTLQDLLEQAIKIERAR